MTNRELDIWIARHLMGLTPEVVENLCRVKYSRSAKQQQGTGMLGTETWDKDCEEWRKEWYRDNEIPYYTESYSDAFQVVEKMKDKDFWFSCSYRDPGPRHYVRFRCIRGGTRPDGLSFYEELPRAICLAAKKAIEGGK